MMCVTLAASRAFKVFIAVCVLCITACNPSVYRKPAEDFQIATTSLRQAYFIELDLSDRARIQQGDLQDQIVIWSAPGEVSGDTVETVLKQMTRRREKDIHDDLKPLREKAFKAVEGYAGVLVSLASDEPTQSIVSEMKGLVQDIDFVLDKAGKMKVAEKYADQLARLTGPLQQYVGVLNEAIRLVSGAIRQRAIVQMIGRSNDSVIELLTVLKGEAITARDNSRSKIKSVRDDLEKFMSHRGFVNAENSVKVEVSRQVANLNVILQQIENDNISDAFDAALKAQGALVRKSIVKDAGDWQIQIRTFREKVALTRAAVEKVRAEM